MKTLLFVLCFLPALWACNAPGTSDGNAAAASAGTVGGGEAASAPKQDGTVAAPAAKVDFLGALSELPVEALQGLPSEFAFLLDPQVRKQPFKHQDDKLRSMFFQDNAIGVYPKSGSAVFECWGVERSNGNWLLVIMAYQKSYNEDRCLTATKSIAERAYERDAQSGQWEKTTPLPEKDWQNLKPRRDCVWTLYWPEMDGPEDDIPQALHIDCLCSGPYPQANKAPSIRLDHKKRTLSLTTWDLTNDYSFCE